MLSIHIIYDEPKMTRVTKFLVVKVKNQQQGSKYGKPDRFEAVPPSACSQI